MKIRKTSRSGAVAAKGRDYAQQVFSEFAWTLASALQAKRTTPPKLARQTTRSKTTKIARTKGSTLRGTSP